MRIGIMSFAHMHAYSYADCIGKLTDVDFVGIFDDNVIRGKEAADHYNTKYYVDQNDFLSLDMDAVIICSENNRHKEMVLSAANAGKHILCEKPIATNLADAKEMITACEDNGVILQIAFPVRFSEPIMRLKTLIDRGELGEIVAFRTTNRGQNPGGWFVDANISGGGAVLDHTVHMVDIMRWFLGKEVVEVNALIDTYFGTGEIDDAGLLTLEFENGVIASHDASWSRPHVYPIWGDATIEVIGTKQSASASAFGEYFRMYRSVDKPLTHVLYGTDMDLSLIKDFVNCIESGKEPSISGYDGLKALEVALLAYESSRSGA